MPNFLGIVFSLLVLLIWTHLFFLAIQKIFFTQEHLFSHSIIQPIRCASCDEMRKTWTNCLSIITSMIRYDVQLLYDKYTMGKQEMGDRKPFQWMIITSLKGKSRAIHCSVWRRNLNQSNFIYLDFSKILCITNQERVGLQINRSSLLLYKCVKFYFNKKK